MKFKWPVLLFPFMLLACDGLENQTKEGLTLAKKKCSSCHQFVEAGKLDRVTWLSTVLPEMSHRAKLNSYELAKITEYYSKMAPKYLPVAKFPEPVERDNWQFEPHQPLQKLTGNSTTTLVTVDKSNEIIYTSDASKASLYRWNKNLQPLDTTYVSSGISNVIFSKNEAVFTLLGDIKPSEARDGALVKYNISDTPIVADSIASLLPRPVYSAAADFNNDRLTDYLTCGFGHENGALIINWQQPDNNYKKEELVSTAGSAQLHLQDFNNDGWMDFMALFSNAEESVRLFINDKNGAFSMQTLIDFPPIAGSTSFQVTDINDDKLPDIIYTSGDNGDLSKIFKPYHGLYIYINKGNYVYKKEYFFPINGCTKAIAADLDNDGDLDIATIAFFADLNNNSAEKCILFEQDKPMHFMPHSPKIDLMGRWLCMDISDYDNDGDYDIILGNYSRGLLNVPVIKNQWDKFTPFTVLINTRLPKNQ